jgi:hypothetical protein
MAASLFLALPMDLAQVCAVLLYTLAVCQEVEIIYEPDRVDPSPWLICDSDQLIYIE